MKIRINKRIVSFLGILFVCLSLFAKSKSKSTSTSTSTESTSTESSYEVTTIKYRILDDPFLRLINVFENKYDILVTFVTYLAITFGMIGILWHVIKLWFGMEQVKKAVIDIFAKFLIYSVLVAAYPSFCKKFWNFSQTVGLNLLGGIDIVQNHFLQLANLTTSQIEGTIAGVSSFLGETIAKDGNNYSAKSLQKFFKDLAEIDMTEEQIEEWAKQNGIVLGKQKYKQASSKIAGAVATGVTSTIGAVTMGILTGGALAPMAGAAALSASALATSNAITAAKFEGKAGSIVNVIDFSNSDKVNVPKSYFPNSSKDADGTISIARDEAEQVFSEYGWTQGVHYLKSGSKYYLLGKNTDNYQLMVRLYKAMCKVYNIPPQVSTDRVNDLKNAILGGYYNSLFMVDNNGNPLDYLSPGQILKMGILISDIFYNIQNYETELSEGNDGAKLRGFKKTWQNILEFIQAIIVKFAIILCVLFIVIDYIICRLEYSVVTLFGYLLIPCILFEGSKTYATNLVRLFVNYLFKILISLAVLMVSLEIFLSYAMSMLLSFGAADTLSFVQILFVTFLVYIINKSAPKFASTLATGQPSLGAGDMVNAGRNVAQGMRTAGKGAQKVGHGAQALGRGGVALTAAGVGAGAAAHAKFKAAKAEGKSGAAAMGAALGAGGGFLAKNGLSAMGRSAAQLITGSKMTQGNNRFGVGSYNENMKDLAHGQNGTTAGFDSIAMAARLGAQAGSNKDKPDDKAGGAGGEKGDKGGEKNPEEFSTTPSDTTNDK